MNKSQTILIQIFSNLVEILFRPKLRNHIFDFSNLTFFRHSMTFESKNMPIFAKIGDFLGYV